MNINKYKFLILIILIVLSCKQKGDNAIIQENEVANDVEIQKPLSNELNNVSNKYDLIKQLLNAVLKEQNKLDIYFNFPLKDQNLIYWVEGFNHDTDYSNVKEVSKSFFYENIDFYFSKNFKNCLSKCNIEILQKEGKSNYETSVNGNKLKIDLTIEKDTFKINYYEEFFDENDQMKYESVIEYIFNFESNKLHFKNSNIAG